MFGVDDQGMELVVLDLLRARGFSLAVAESVSGGLVAARLAAIPGASDVLRGAVVAYASEVKFDLLGVPEGPVVTPEAAAAMAAGVRRLLKADVGLATTGVAGPAEQEGRPVGTVFLGLARGDHVEATRGAPARRSQPHPPVCGDQPAQFPPSQPARPARRHRSGPAARALTLNNPPRMMPRGKSGRDRWPAVEKSSSPAP